jgi:hypothetical protein
MLKWEKYYKTESELIEAMIKINSKVYTALCNNCNLKGYEFIEGFQKYYDKNGLLTEKQIYTLKKLLAEHVYNYHHKGHIKDNKFYYEIGISGITEEKMYYKISI